MNVWMKHGKGNPACTQDVVGGVAVPVKNLHTPEMERHSLHGLHEALCPKIYIIYSGPHVGAALQLVRLEGVRSFAQPRAMSDVNVSRRPVTIPERFHQLALECRDLEKRRS